MAKKNRKNPGRCVFCNSIGLSKEHIWSDWLKGVLTAGISENHSTTTCDNIFNQSLPIQTTKRQGKMHQRKVRNVCETCNNGWMSRVVNSAKPHATKLITDEPCKIDELHIPALAAWIALTTVMAEFTQVETMAIPRPERVSLMAKGCPPENWTIVCGRYGDSSSEMHYRHWGGKVIDRRSLPPGPFQIDTAKLDMYQVSTILLGKLAIQVFTSTHAFTVLRYRAFIRGSKMHRLWPQPAALQAWPPADSLNDTEFMAIMDGFIKTALGLR